jgi:hypothetical protein
MQEQAADVDQAVLLGGDGRAVGEVEHLTDDVARGLALELGLALADEPGVLGEAARVEEEGELVAIADPAHLADVLEADGLSAAGVVGDGHHHQGDARGAHVLMRASRRATSMFPLKGWRLPGSAASGMGG